MNKEKKRKKNVIFSGRTNVIASRPPERRPPEMPHACANTNTTDTDTPIPKSHTMTFVVLVPLSLSLVLLSFASQSIATSFFGSRNYINGLFWFYPVLPYSTPFNHI